MDCHFFRESFNRVCPLELFKLNGGVLVEELIDREVTSANPDFDALLLDFDSDSLGTELVDALGLPHKHDFELGPLGVVVDELSQFFVDLIVLNWDVNCDSLFEVNDVSLECANFNFSILQLF